MRKIISTFDFDDILIIPEKKTHITSRYTDIFLPKQLPLFVAPMDTVINLNNIETFLDEGINVTLPRTISYSEYDKLKITKNNLDKQVFVSLGINELSFFYKNNFKGIHLNANVLLDVANGHMQQIMDYTRELKRLRPDIKIMVGNIANPKTYKWYADAGCVDYIRVGIGNGNGCLTTKQSGIGYPMASLIYETYKEKELLLKSNDIKGNIPAIVADGGMKDYSDVIKSLALGADYVMIGSIFNKCIESIGQNYLYGFKINNTVANYLFKKKYPVKKYFRGMSTKEAQKAMGKTQIKTSEGVIRIRRVEYSLSTWIDNFEHYLRNAMSYSNAKTLSNFIGKTNICRISNSAFRRFNK